jgi:2-polyprenyl-6-methoxyphenol hydroxylase-like FAD-dependent oxidoreductase
MYMNIDAEVLVVGGGPVGLTLASDLAVRKHSTILVESRQEPTTHPKATLLGARSMEYFRRWGLDDAIFERALPPDENYWIIFCTRLSGYEIARFSSPSINEVRFRPPGTEKRWPELAWSPYGKTQIGQLDLEPVLLKFARSLDKLDMKHGHKFLSFEDYGDHVVSELENLNTGKKFNIHSKYLVACDGGSSIIRKSLGFNMGGRGPWRSNVSLYFRSPDFLETHGKGLGNLYFIFAPDSFGVFTAIDGKELWSYQLYFLDSTRKTKEINPEEILHRAMGKTFKFELLATTHWQHHQSVAAEWQKGNVFLAGDAAHLFAPTGGVGMNTGIADACDLSWKLDATLSGWGGKKLLSSYQAERRPVAWRNSQRSMINSDTIDFVMSQVPQEIGDETPQGKKLRKRLKEDIHWMARQFNSAGAHLGHRYFSSPIIIPDGTPEPPDDLSRVTQSTWPGSRAPHAWIGDGLSTLDWFGDGFVLYFIPGRKESAQLIEKEFKEQCIPISLATSTLPNVQKLYEAPLVLVRPDGHVTWRGEMPPENITNLALKAAGQDIITNK